MKEQKSYFLSNWHQYFFHGEHCFLLNALLSWEREHKTMRISITEGQSKHKNETKLEILARRGAKSPVTLGEAATGGNVLADMSETEILVIFVTLI